MRGVSFLVCTYNGADRLPAVLDHLARQQNPSGVPWEVILIDNASTDNSGAIAQQHWSRPEIPLRVVVEPRPGLSYARVTGLNQANYSIACFIDDDNWVSPGWLTGIVRIMDEHPRVGACGGYIAPVFEAPAPAWFETAKERYATSTDTREAGVIHEPSSFLAGAGLTVRREAWLQLQSQGFRFRTVDRRGKDLSSGGDAELCLALRLAGWDLWFEYSLELEHFLPAHRLNWRYARDLYRGCASCAAVLDAYLQVLTRPIPPRDTLDRYRKTGGNSWTWHLFSALRRLLRQPRALLAATMGPAENDLAVLDVEMNLGRLYSYLEYRREYDRAIRELAAAPWRQNPQ